MRIRGLEIVIVVVVAVVSLAGCGGEPVGVDTSSITSSRGIDYAWGRPSPHVIRSRGYTFAARYLSYDASKDLSAGEAHALRAAGVDVLVVWEAGASDALGGFSVGAAEARDAEREAAACGQPAGRPIYFAVDFDATPGDQSAIDSYFDGVASVIGRARTGVYAGYWVVKRLFDAGKISYGWQTYAWSGGNWDHRAQLRQIDNGVSVDGVDSDIDESVAADFGQWGYVPWVELVDEHSGKCMDVKGDASANRTNIELWGCNHRGSQTFRIEPIAGGDVRIVHKDSGKCVDVTGEATADGTNIELFACDGRGSQSFAMKSEGGGAFTFVNTHADKCIDVDGRATADGTNVQLWACNGGSNQKWRVQAR